jgi:hypothetical protein
MPKPADIKSTGAWVVRKDFEYLIDTNLTAGLARLYRQHGRDVSVLDAGAGTGRYVRQLRAFGLDAIGIDGPSAARLSDGLVRGVDLTQPFVPCPSFTWVMSLETAEHIPPAHEEAYLDNLNCSASFGLVLSWAPPSQFGHGHDNPRERSSVIRRLAHFGFRVDYMLSSLLASHASLRWFRNNLLVFVRNGGHQQLHRHADGALLPSGWLARARRGYCNATSSRPTSCTWDHEGSAVMHPETGDVAGPWACIKRCLGCAHCRYVSLSPAYDDCSWHQACDMDKLHKGAIPGEPEGSADTFVTVSMPLRVGV